MNIEKLMAAIECDRHNYKTRQQLQNALKREISQLWKRILELDSRDVAREGPLAKRVAGLHLRLGRANAELGHHSMAQTCFRRSLQLLPGGTEAMLALGLSLLDDRRFRAAVNVLRRLLAVAPHEAEGMAGLGGALLALKQEDEAELWLQRARTSDPGSATSLIWMAHLHTLRGQSTKAMACLDEAIALGTRTARARAYRGILRLKQGDYEMGWEDYEYRYAANPSAYLGFPWDEPQWDGRALAGQIIFVHERLSVIDTLSLVRFLPAVKARGGRVMLGCHCELINLLRRSPGVDRIAQPGGVKLEEFDVQIALPSLPAVLGVTLDSVTPTLPYIFPSPQRTAVWRERLRNCGGPDGLRIGLAWSSDEVDEPLEDAFARLVEVPMTKGVSLELGERYHRAVRGSAMLDFGEELIDFDDVAAVVANLDLVISVDTAVAHLAGAMGKPVWLLLPLNADWRWPSDRHQSPWYPTARLFRQTAGGDWNALIAQVRAALHQHVAGNVRVKA